MVVDLSIDHVIIHCWQSAQETNASWSIHSQKSILRTPPTSRRRLQSTAKSSLGNGNLEKATFLTTDPPQSARKVAKKLPMNPPNALPNTPNQFDSTTKR